MEKTIQLSFKNLLVIFIVIIVLALIAAVADYSASKYKKPEAVPAIPAIPAINVLSQQEIGEALSVEVPVAERPVPLTQEEIQKALNKKINNK